MVDALPGKEKKKGNFMEIKNLWELPFPSTYLHNVHFIDKTADPLIVFDYCNQSHSDKICNGGILLDGAQAYRFTSDKFSQQLNCAHNTLMEYNNSKWLNELTKINPEIALSDFWYIRHFAIFFDNYGLYEIIARDYKILEMQEGSLPS
jgi:hypothetical protein